MIKCTQLTKTYGPKTAVDDISFEILAGHLTGYVGPNGAGKSTTVKMLTGMLRPTAGTIDVDGKDVQADPIGVKSIIGYVPETGAAFEALTGFEFVQMMGRLHGLPDGQIAERATRLADLFDLDATTFRRQLISTYSKGTRQKAVILAALIHDPKVILLDEPLSGLDPGSAFLFKEIVRQLAREGKCILFCSHVMEVVEKLCDRILVLHHGRIVADGTLEQLQALTGKQSLEDIFGHMTADSGLASKLETISRGVL